MNAINEPMTTAYLARRGVSPQWRAFLRALVETLDQHLDADGRASLMRAVGRRMADANPLPHCDTLLDMEARINEVLAIIEWGYAELLVETGTRRLCINHYVAPAVGTGTDADGRWTAAVLEGLYAGWLGNQPGGDGSLRPVSAEYAPGRAVLFYGRTVQLSPSED